MELLREEHDDILSEMGNAIGSFFGFGASSPAKRKKQAPPASDRRWYYRAYCPSGHVMSAISGLPYDTGRSSCDQCKARSIHLDEIAWHCSQCKYDLCEACVKAVQ